MLDKTDFANVIIVIDPDIERKIFDENKCRELAGFLQVTRLVDKNHRIDRVGDAVYLREKRIFGGGFPYVAFPLLSVKSGEFGIGVYFDIDVFSIKTMESAIKIVFVGEARRIFASNSFEAINKFLDR
jgi:hypothetical protein